MSIRHKTQETQENIRYSRIGFEKTKVKRHKACGIFNSREVKAQRMLTGVGSFILHHCHIHTIIQLCYQTGAVKAE